MQRTVITVFLTMGCTADQPTDAPVADVWGGPPPVVTLPYVVPGQEHTIELSGAPNGLVVYFVVSAALPGGPNACPPVFAPLCLTIPAPAILVGLDVTSAGRASATFDVPEFVPRSEVRFQPVALLPTNEYARGPAIVVPVLQPADDEDGDGITNADEVQLGTNALEADTDGDGALDGVDDDPLDDQVGTGCGGAALGTVSACDIDTPTGPCAGTWTCQPGGWDACAAPSSVDPLDDLGVDANCDGFDGLASDAVFVDPAAVDTAGCGVDISAPCGSVQAGADQALALGRSQLYLKAGDHDGVTELSQDLALVGGFDADWQRAALDTPGHDTALTGGLLPGGAAHVSLWVQGPANVSLRDLSVVAPDAASVASQGRSSVALYAVDATITGTQVRLVGGTGENGAAGLPGANAPFLFRSSGNDGDDGGPGGTPGGACNSTSRGSGGMGGGNSCDQGPSRGGDGGLGGTMDTSCGLFPDYSSRVGITGMQGLSSPLGGGAGGARGFVCAAGGDGFDGPTVNGLGGPGALLLGFLLDGFWVGTRGEDGLLGDSGGAGGGGGGAGGCSTGTDSFGGGGGGGGAGGCRALGAGRGGGPGGASFVVVVHDATVDLTSCEVVGGTGGTGGAGGVGGQGQEGGLGGSGGTAFGAFSGGDGGDGGHGGHGGGGGGGLGGRAGAFMIIDAGSPPSGCALTPGTPGPGGAGGLSAPNAPIAIRDGNPGGAGPTFPWSDVVQCDSATGACTP